MRVGCWLLVISFWTGLMFLGTSVVKAAITFGNGYYTNLCDSGTKATYYNCDRGCNVTTGTCAGDNNRVVKYVCLGKWNQCLESESQWSNFEQVSGVGCGYTVQLSLFDKKCRNEDGFWDNSCQLQGYMVWFSGDCVPGYVQVTSVPRSTVTTFPTNTPGQAVIISRLGNLTAALGGASPTVVPTVTSQPTVKTVANICGVKCGSETECGAGFACISGVCRNPDCSADVSCFCKGNSISVKPVVLVKKTPDTGMETWLGMASMVALGGTGLKLIRMARKVW